MMCNTIVATHKQFIDAAFRLLQSGDITEQNYQDIEDRYRRLKTK